MAFRNASGGMERIAEARKARPPVFAKKQKLDKAALATDGNAHKKNLHIVTIATNFRKQYYVGHELHYKIIQRRK
ncbi:MAG: hypothetical protein IKI31_05890 [Treponema sp.]|nr:hypothetical protein [Treponema sp.]